MTVVLITEKNIILAIPISSKVNTLIITVVIRRNNRH